MTTESQTGEEPTILWGGFEFFPKKVTTDTFGIPLDALEWRPNECRRRNLPEDDEMDTYFATREDRDIALSEKPKWWFPIETETSWFWVWVNHRCERFHGIRFVPERLRDGIPESALAEAVLRIYPSEKLKGMTKNEFLAEFRDVWQGWARSLWFFDKPATSFRYEAKTSGLEIELWIGSPTGKVATLKRKMTWTQVYDAAFSAKNP